MPTTANMDLILPTVSTTLGPAWATELNTALETVDSHDHTQDKGVPVPTDGINIDADFPINSFNLTSIKSSRFTSQASALGTASDINCSYVAGGDLWFNDASGVQIQLTAGGALNAASIGGIGGDYGTSTASLFYTSIDETFYFTSDTNKSANVDVGNIVVREPSVSSPNGITIKSPTGLGSDYNLTLPTAVPASSSLIFMSNTGALSTSTTVPTANIADSAVTTAKIADSNVTTAKIADSNVTTAKIADINVTTAKIADGAVTAAKLAGENLTRSSSSGTFSTASASYADVTNLSVTVTAANRPIVLVLDTNGSGGDGKINVSGSDGALRFVKAGVAMADCLIGQDMTLPPSAYSAIDDSPGTGSVTYKVQVKVTSGSVLVYYAKLIAYEL
jgi:hypothetical protein